MESSLNTVQDFLIQSSIGNTLVMILLLVFLIVIHFYSISRGKKELLRVVDNKVKVFQKAFDISEDGVLIFADKNKVLYANRIIKKLLGLEKNFLFKPLALEPKIKLKGKWFTLGEAIAMDNRKTEDTMISYLQVEMSVDSSQNNIIPINLYIDSSPLGSKHDIWSKIIFIHDLRQKEQHKIIGYMHQLSNLPNQAQLLHDLNALYAKLHLNKKKLALVLIDIDDFSTLRSIIGYEQINNILVKFATYLQNIPTNLEVSAYHTYYNNFLLTISNLDDEKEAYVLIKNIQEQLASFYKMQDVKLYLTASVGVSIYNGNGSARGLLDRSYKALSQAQTHGNGRIQEYVPEISSNDYDALILHNEMHQALEKKQFEIYYQPIVDGKSEEVVSAEALIRWNHPKYGLIAPYIFIPIMEKTGFIIEIGKYVLEEVLKQQKRWELFKFKQIDVSINITLFEIESEHFVENVEKQLQYHQVDPSLIKFEITEGSAMISEESTQKQFMEIKKLGIGISLDDFGTGYTSFVYMKKFPADILKIDKTMIDYILTNKDDQKIVKAMIEMGHSLGMKVVAEGIENKRMYDLLASYECDMMQGYYFSKPVPVFEFQKLLR